MKEVQYVGVHAIRTQEVAMRCVVLCMVALLLLMVSDVALAQGTDAFVGTKFSSAMKNLVATMNGTVARSLAGIAVMGVGFMALTARMEWSKGIVVVSGVGLIFSATALIDALFGLSAT